MKPGQTGMPTGGYGWDQPTPPHAGFSPAPQAPLFDAELGQIFIKMRSFLGVGLWDMARMVNAEPAAIANLEAGALDALPAWPELTRLVDAYATLTGVDAQPILARLLRAQSPTGPAGGTTAAAPMVMMTPVRTQTTQPHFQDRPAQPQPAWVDTRPASAGLARQLSPPGRNTALADVSTVPTAARRPLPGQRNGALAVDAEVVRPGGAKLGRFARAAGSTARGLHRSVRGRAASLGIVAGVPAMLLALGWLSPALLYAAVSPLPQAIAAPVVWCVDHVVTWVAPTREGLTWIDIGDPRLRKADRLPERGR